MCQHRYLIERRPDPEDYNTWEDVEELPIGGGRRADPDGERAAHEHALQVAADYALAHPERASELYISRLSCNGPWDDPERPYPYGNTRHSNEEVEQTPLYRALEALMLRVRAGGDEQTDDEVADIMDTLYPRHVGAQEQRLAAENLRLRAALGHYADPSAWRVRAIEREPGRLTVELPISADAGARARAALRGEELPEREAS